MLRREYRLRLEQAEDRLLGLAEHVFGQVRAAVQTDAVEAARRTTGWRDAELATARRADVLRDDLLSLVAREAPVADDLRLVHAFHMVLVRLRSIAAIAAAMGPGVARAVLAADDPGARQLRELGDQALRLLDDGLAALTRRDATSLPSLRSRADALSRLRRGLRRRHLDELRRPDAAVERILVREDVARALERLGGLAVGLVEDVEFLTRTRRRASDGNGGRAQGPDGVRT